MGTTLRARAFGPLAKVEWTIPQGVSVVVGPNRVGKSTLLALPEFIRIAIWKGVHDAVKQVFDGPAHLRHFGAPVSTPCRVGMTVGRSSWDMELAIASGAIEPYCPEELSWDDNLVLVRPAGSAMGEHEGRTFHVGEDTMPGALHLHCLKTFRGDVPWDRFTDGLEDERLLPFEGDAVRSGVGISVVAHRFSAYKTYNYDLRHLAKYGSIQSDSTELQPDGTNVFPLLRNWRDSSETEARFEFVMSTMRAAFPHLRKFDFEQAGQTVTVAIRDERWTNKIPIARESTGFLTALMQVCAVASTPYGGSVMLDELETSLHPSAIRVLIDAFRSWAAQFNLSVVLATQSQTVLDQFYEDPESVYVIEPGHETTPKPLTDLFEGDYLRQFSLGDLFAHLEYGSYNNGLTDT